MVIGMPNGGIFFFFACINIISFGLCFFLPETRGLSLESMDLIFGSTTREERDSHIARQAAELAATEKTVGLETAHHEDVERKEKA